MAFWTPNFWTPNFWTPEFWTFDSGDLAAGVASLTFATPTRIVATATDASGGWAPYSYQWERSATGGGAGFTPLGGQTSLTLDDQTVGPQETWFYRLVYTDDVTDTVTSNEITATTPGVPTPGGGGAFRPRPRQVAAIMVVTHGRF